jgi:hypothetical protein
LPTPSPTKNGNVGLLIKVAKGRKQLCSSRLAWFWVKFKPLVTGNPQPDPKFDYNLTWHRRLSVRSAELLSARVVGWSRS